jgi:hypothetical protein
VDQNELYLCFQKEENYPNKVLVNKYLFVVFEYYSKRQKYMCEIELEDFRGFLIYPKEPNLLFLIQNNVYIELDLSSGKFEEKIRFKGINRILYAKFSENGNYLIEIRQFKGIQIWNMKRQRVTLFNFDEKFDLVFRERPEEFPKDYDVFAGVHGADIDVRCLMLKDGKQAILV